MPLYLTPPAIPPFTSVGPTGSLYETFPRILGNNNLGAVTSGKISIIGTQLPAGLKVTNINLTSGLTAGTTLTNCWACVYTMHLTTPGKLAVSTSITATPWAASTVRTFNFATPYVIPTTGPYYLGICVVGSVMPTLNAFVPSATTAYQGTGMGPFIAAQSGDTGLTTAASAPTTMATITTSQHFIHMWIT